MLALPSYAAVFDGGSWGEVCTPEKRSYGLGLLNPPREKAGEMIVNVTGVKLNAGIDNRGLTVTGSLLECPGLTGFYQSLGLVPHTHLGFVQSNPNLNWYDGEYFEIGNGLAMKVMVGDFGASSLQTLIQGASPIITFPETTGSRDPQTLGIAVQASLKVIGSVDSNIPINDVRIGTLEYKLWGGLLGINSRIAYAPIIFNINVQQAVFKSCTLADANSVFTLLTVGKSGLDVPGTELHGGEITVGPVVCPEGVDVKVNFFDNATAANGLTDYLRTVYSDDNMPSQYALKFYPIGGGDPLKFLPRTQLQEGWGPATNDTTVNFTQSPTSAASSVHKNYTVKYIKTTNAGGSDRPGPIKGIMTVQFLYY